MQRPRPTTDRPAGQAAQTDHGVEARGRGRESSPEQVARALRERILGNELPPGTPLREVALAEAAGVSRHTVRAAVQLLVHQGLAQREMHRGATVKRLTERDAREIYGIRRVLEIAAVEASADRDPAAFEPLRDALRGLERAALERDGKKLDEADLRFHRRLVELLGSDRILAFFQSIENELRLGMSIVTFTDRAHENPDPLVAEHRQILELLVARRIEECRSVLTEHLDYYELRMVDLLRAMAEGERSDSGSSLTRPAIGRPVSPGD